MKKQSIQILGVTLVAVGLTACSGLGKLVKNADKITYKVTPDPMEMHGDSVGISITGTYPPKIFPKKATVTVIPVIKYGSMAIPARNTAPTNVILVMILSRYSVVGLPGRSPGINPPYFFILSAISMGLTWTAV